MDEPSRVPPASRGATARPILSICIVAHTAHFGDDYKYRICTCLSFLVKGLVNLGREKDVELIVADCSSEGRLHEQLVLPPVARDLVRFLVIPADLVRQNGAEAGHAIGFNSALRRSRGEYILHLSADAILTTPSLDTLLSIIDGTYPSIPVREALFDVLRRQLNARQVERQPSLRELEEYLCRNLASLPVIAMGYGGGGDVLMHRSLWEAAGGYDETIGERNLADADLVLRVAQRYPLIQLGNFGVGGAYLEQHHQILDGSSFRPRKDSLPCDTSAFIANRENWGLADQDLKTHCIEHVLEEEPADEASRVGTTEQWTATRHEVVEQLANPAMNEQLRALLSSIRINREAIRPSLREMNAFVALVWHAQRRAVRIYVETGMKTPYAACLVTRNSPGAEVYAVVDWHRPVRDGHSLLFVNNNLLKALGQHWGYIRFTGDDPATAVTRIAKSAAGRFAVDLALVRCGSSFPAAPRQAAELAAYLTPGGAIVVSADDEQSFNATWSFLASQRPALTYLRFSDRCSGIALAASLAE